MFTRLRAATHYQKGVYLSSLKGQIALNLGLRQWKTIARLLKSGVSGQMKIMVVIILLIALPQIQSLLKQGQGLQQENIGGVSGFQFAYPRK